MEQNKLLKESRTLVLLLGMPLNLLQALSMTQVSQLSMQLKRQQKMSEKQSKMAVKKHGKELLKLSETASMKWRVDSTPCSEMRIMLSKDQKESLQSSPLLNKNVRLFSEFMIPIPIKNSLGKNGKSTLNLRKTQKLPMKIEICPIGSMRECTSTISTIALTNSSIWQNSSITLITQLLFQP